MICHLVKPRPFCGRDYLWVTDQRNREAADRKSWKNLARPEGFEPPTYRFEAVPSTHSEGPRRQTYPTLLNISTFIFSLVLALPVQSGHQLVANDPPVDQLAYKFTIRSNTESQGTTGERSVVFTGFRLFSFPSHPVTTAHCGSKMVADGDENLGIAYRYYDCCSKKSPMKSTPCSNLLPLCYHSIWGLTGSPKGNSK